MWSWCVQEREDIIPQNIESMKDKNKQMQLLLFEMKAMLQAESQSRIYFRLSRWKKQAALRETVSSISAVLTHNNWSRMPK